jgi:hypothetical protein
MLLPGRSAEDVTSVVFCLGALFLLPVLFRADLHWLGQVNGWLMMLHLGLIATALSYWLFASGLATVPASTAVTLSLAEPMTAAAWRLVVAIEHGGRLLFSSFLPPAADSAGRMGLPAGRQDDRSTPATLYAPPSVLVDSGQRLQTVPPRPQRLSCCPTPPSSPAASCSASSCSRAGRHAAGAGRQDWLIPQNSACSILF